MGSGVVALFWVQVYLVVMRQAGRFDSPCYTNVSYILPSCSTTAHTSRTMTSVSLHTRARSR